MISEGAASPQPVVPSVGEQYHGAKFVPAEARGLMKVLESAREVNSTYKVKGVCNTKVGNCRTEDERDQNSQSRCAQDDPLRSAETDLNKTASRRSFPEHGWLQRHGKESKPITACFKYPLQEKAVSFFETQAVLPNCACLLRKITAILPQHEKIERG